MSKLIKGLLKSSQQDRVERFRIHSIPEGVDLTPYEVALEKMVGTEWLREFVDPPMDSSDGECKKFRDRIYTKRKQFRNVLWRNLSCGINQPDFVEKLTRVDQLRATGNLGEQESLEYYTNLLNPEVAEELVKKRSDRMSGANNISVGHGGRNSPYSMKFSGYNGMSDEEKKATIKELQDKRSETVKDNPQNNPKRPEYYMTRLGVSEEEAIRLVSESQSTFSLARCIEKHGEKHGIERFTKRQDKWQTTLGDAPIDEQYDIARRKASSVGVNIPEKKIGTSSNIYIILLSGGYTKIGHTSDLATRCSHITHESGEKVNGVLYFECKIEDAYDIEDFLVTSLKDHSVFMHGNKINGVRSTEYFYSSEEFDNELDKLLGDLGVTLGAYTPS